VSEWYLFGLIDDEPIKLDFVYFLIQDFFDFYLIIQTFSVNYATKTLNEDNKLSKNRVKGFSSIEKTDLALVLKPK